MCTIITRRSSHRCISHCTQPTVHLDARIDRCPLTWGDGVHLLGMSAESDERPLHLGPFRRRLPARPRHGLGVESLLGELTTAPHGIVHERLLRTHHLAGSELELRGAVDRIQSVQVDRIGSDLSCSPQVMMMGTFSLPRGSLFGWNASSCIQTGLCLTYVERGEICQSTDMHRQVGFAQGLWLVGDKCGII